MLGVVEDSKAHHPLNLSRLRVEVGPLLRTDPESGLLIIRLEKRTLRMSWGKSQTILPGTIPYLVALFHYHITPIRGRPPKICPSQNGLLQPLCLFKSSLLSSVRN
jgi:hypothetical protein